ncbi:tetratricopeptide repeat protein [Nitrogeniibacter aestuarii]|uniref:tetratricopeptide repeat protein n=1 Tax=Nitrogeniibacter aestuarii TaxID=2815343 RepID=UPI001E2BD525|nr:tetratricopeptide repeat protein [Nitrogeniibacter aestuarii]
MSLLIDALRKAEKDREQSSPARDDLEGLTLEPISPASDAPMTLPPELTSDQRAAANLFDVNRQSSPPSPLVWFAIAGVVGGLAIGAYVWWQMQPANTLLITRGEPAPIEVQVAPTPSPRVDVTPPPASTETAPTAASAIQRIAPAAPTRPASSALPPPDIGNLGDAEPPTPAAPPAEAPVRLARTQSAPSAVPPQLAAGYAAYQAGDLATAQRHYAMHLRRDPNNVDALNGMGAIAMRDGRPEDAIRWFRRSLEAVPGDSVATVGLASLLPTDDIVAQESRLRSQFESSPDDGTTPFALGNALARQGRWSEAQSAYFDAHTADPGNPDYLFNLAVSLDQLGQPALAQTYYRRALDAARSRPAAFDSISAQTRLAELDGGTR